MCHLCRKAQALGSLDNKALEPIGRALARLHRNFAPDLGSFWEGRYDATIRLRIALASLQRVVPIQAATEMLAEVDDELLHCEKQMVEHPTAELPGDLANSSSDEFSDSSITPNDSASVKARIQREQQVTAKTMQAGSSPQRSKEKEDASQYNLAGSDLDPHPVLVRRSCLIVQAWLEKCDTATANRCGKDLDVVSIVSVPGGFRERPQLDVPVWERPLGREDSFPASFTPRERDRSHRCHHQRAKDKACSDQPDSHLTLESDSCVTDRMPRNRSPKRKVKFIEKVFSALHRQKSANMDKKDGRQRRVRFEDEESHQRRRVKRANPKPRRIEERKSTFEKDIRWTSTTLDHETIYQPEDNESSSGVISSSKDSKKHVDENIEDWDSASSYLSSRESEINLGSIIGQPTSPSSAHLSTGSLASPVPQGSREFQPSPPRPNASWTDNHSRSLGSMDAQNSYGTATSFSKPRHIKSSTPNSTPIVPSHKARVEESEPKFDKKRERRRAERNAHASALPPATANSAFEMENGRLVASPMIKDRRSRRAERASKASGTDKYYRDERQRLWSWERAQTGAKETVTQSGT